MRITQLSVRGRLVLLLVFVNIALLGPEGAPGRVVEVEIAFAQ